MNLNDLLKEDLEQNLLYESGIKIPKRTKAAKILFH